MMSSSFKLVEIGYSNIMRHCCLVYTVFIRGLFFYFYSLIICHWILFFFLTLLSRPNSQRYAPGFSFYFILKKEEDGWYIIIRRFPNSQVLFFFLFHFYSSVVAGFLFLALLNQRERRQGIYIECRTYIYQPNKKRVELNLILIQTKKKKEKNRRAHGFSRDIAPVILLQEPAKDISLQLLLHQTITSLDCVCFFLAAPTKCCCTVHILTRS